jgi:hypothetical protein
MALRLLRTCGSPGNAMTASRIVNFSPPGSLLKQFSTMPRSRARALGKHGRVHNESHLSLVRQCPCLKCGMEDMSEAAHVRMNSAAFGKRTGAGEKPDDLYALPLCAGCHRLDPDSQHKIGEAEFWRRLGINPLLVCRYLAAATGDLVKMRAVVLTAIAGRAS